MQKTLLIWSCFARLLCCMRVLVLGGPDRHPSVAPIAKLPLSPDARANPMQRLGMLLVALGESSGLNLPAGPLLKTRSLGRSVRGPSMKDVDIERTGSIVVTDGSGSFNQSRSIFNMLFDSGRYKSIVACSASATDLKTMLMSRQSRYSGLFDVLRYHEGTPPSVFPEVDTWLAVNPDAAIAEQIDAAALAGIRRIFLIFSDAVAIPAAVDARLKATGMAFTVMRTGPLIDMPIIPSSNSALKLDNVNRPMCEDVPRDDAFRFATEALTLDEAHSRAFTLCPTKKEDWVSKLKQMRRDGNTTRDETLFILTGEVDETTDDKEETPEQKKEKEAKSLTQEEEERKSFYEEAQKKAREKARLWKYEKKREKIEQMEKQAFREAWQNKDEKAMSYTSWGYGDERAHHYAWVKRMEKKVQKGVPLRIPFVVDDEKGDEKGEAVEQQEEGQ